jgi:hypothetical protein
MHRIDHKRYIDGRYPELRHQVIAGPIFAQSRSTTA